ncbi:GTP-binding protein [bacterium]|nr:GTP-binding protein [bacterium]
MTTRAVMKNLRLPEKAKVNLIGGFLGSGKTTLLRHFLSRPKLSEKVAILVNELGAIGIDGQTLARSGGNMVELANGCICCQISEDLVSTLVQIFDTQKPDRILIESTGVAEPGKILNVLYSVEPILRRMRVDPTIIVVDAGAFERFKTALAYHYVMQIKSADVILLNKIDLSKPKSLAKVERAIRDLNPKAFLLRTDHCRVDLLRLIEGIPAQTPAGTPDDHGHEHTDDEFESFAVTEDTPYDRGKLEAFLAKLPDNVFRAKGFAKTPQGRHLVNFTAGEVEFEDIPAKEFPKQAGLVFIGRHLDEKKLRGALKRCKAG